jgi:hypothetical protein
MKTAVLRGHWPGPWEAFGSRLAAQHLKNSIRS